MRAWKSLPGQSLIPLISPITRSSRQSRLFRNLGSAVANYLLGFLTYEDLGVFASVSQNTYSIVMADTNCRFHPSLLNGVSGYQQLWATEDRWCRYLQGEPKILKSEHRLVRTRETLVLPPRGRPNQFLNSHYFYLIEDSFDHPKYRIFDVETRQQIWSHDPEAKIRNDAIGRGGRINHLERTIICLIAPYFTFVHSGSLHIWNFLLNQHVQSMTLDSLGCNPNSISINLRGYRDEYLIITTPTSATTITLAEDTITGKEHIVIVSQWKHLTYCDTHFGMTSNYSVIGFDSDTTYDLQQFLMDEKSVYYDEHRMTVEQAMVQRQQLYNTQIDLSNVKIFTDLFQQHRIPIDQLPTFREIDAIHQHGSYLLIRIAIALRPSQYTFSNHPETQTVTVCCNLAAKRIVWIRHNIWDIYPSPSYPHLHCTDWNHTYQIVDVTTGKILYTSYIQDEHRLVYVDRNVVLFETEYYTDLCHLLLGNNGIPTMKSDDELSPYTQIIAYGMGYLIYLNVKWYDMDLGEHAEYTDLYVVKM